MNATLSCRLTRNTSKRLADGRSRTTVDAGRATSLVVTGDAPDSLPSAIEVTTTPDRTDTFPIRSLLPLHVAAALVRQSMTAGRRTFRSLPEGVVTIDVCRGAEGPFTDATCH